MKVYLVIIGVMIMTIVLLYQFYKEQEKKDSEK